MAYVHFWTEAPKCFIAPTHCRVEAIKLSGRVIFDEPERVSKLKNKFLLLI